MRVDDYCRALIGSTKLDGTAQAVLWMIASHVNRRTGETFVSLDTIASECRMHRDTVGRAATDLRKAAAFTILERPGRSSVYRFPIHPALSTPPAEPRGVEQADPPRNRGGPSADPRVHPSRRRGGNHVPNHVPNRGDCCADGYVTVHNTNGTKSAAPCPTCRPAAVAQ